MKIEKLAAIDIGSNAIRLLVTNVITEREGKEPELFGVWDVNVNQLIPMGHEGKAGLGAPIKSMLCKVYKAKG